MDIYFRISPFNYVKNKKGSILRFKLHVLPLILKYIFKEDISG